MFLDGDEQEEVDARLQHLLFHQTVHSVIFSRHPTTEDEALLFAGLMMQSEFGDYKTSEAAEIARTLECASRRCGRARDTNITTKKVRARLIDAAQEQHP